MKGIRRTTTVLKQPTKTFQVLQFAKNVTSNFIRMINKHHKSTLCIILVYCLIFSLNCLQYVNCDIEPHPINNQFNDNENIASNLIPVSVVFS